MIPPQTGYYYFQSLRTANLPRRELEILQTRKLKVALRYAGQTVPMYRETFKRIGFDPETLTKVEDLRRLPTHSKSDILGAQEEAAAAGRTRGAKMMTTTGTTGRPSVLARDRDSSALDRALSFRKMTGVGIRPWSRVATLWAPERYWRQEVKNGVPEPTTGVYNLPVKFLGRNLPNLMTLWVDPSRPDLDGRTLAAFRPQFLYSRPSHLRRIARYFGEAPGIRPKVIMATGEIVTETGFKDLRRAYGAKVIRNYGAVGLGTLAGDCLHETGLHTWEDYKIYEVLDGDEQVSPGEVGELVMTVLHPDVVPLVRFRTGDYVRLGSDDRCECGSSTRRLATIEGREDDCVVGSEGRRFGALEVADRIESQFGFRDFQLIQSGPRRFSLLLRGDDMNRKDEFGRVRAYLEELTGPPVQIEVSQRSDDDYWMKTRPVVCKVR